jgi:integrase
MEKRGTISLGTVYKRKGSKSYYFKHTDQNGKRHQTSTGKTGKKAATLYAEEYLSRLRDRQTVKQSSLLEQLTQYLTPETNPRYKEAQVSGGHYTHRYALLIARNTAGLIEVLKTEMPHLLDLPVSDLIRRDIKDVAAAIVKVKGHTRTAQMLYSALKVALSQAEEDGIINQSPAKGLANIKYQEKKKQAITPDLIAWMISRKDLFPSYDFWAYMTVIAGSGMRRGEALAINKDRIFNGVLCIDQQFTEGALETSLPKWEIVRHIPLSRLALDALATIEPNADGFYFPHYGKWIDIQMGRLKASLMAADPSNKEVWKSLGPHLLRHSCNTNLLVSGASPVLVAEYLAWKHQELIDIQRRYTHMIAMNLKPVADAIDAMYSPAKEDEKKKILHFQA